MPLESALLFETPEEIFLRVFADLKPRSAKPAIEVRFCRFANANSFVRLEGASLTVRITDVLDGAPSGILESLAYILLSKLFRKPVPAAFQQRYRRYLNRKEMRRSLHLIRQERGRKYVADPRGDVYNIEAMFEELNFRYFHGLMARPDLGWTRGASRTTLGHYDPSHNAIVLSRILDRPQVPKIAVEYVLFHEMLHLRFPVDHRGARRCVHTPEFRAAERAFVSWKEAKELLKQL